MSRLVVFVFRVATYDVEFVGLVLFEEVGRGAHWDESDGVDEAVVVVVVVVGFEDDCDLAIFCKMREIAAGFVLILSRSSMTLLFGVYIYRNDHNDFNTCTFI